MDTTGTGDAKLPWWRTAAGAIGGATALITAVTGLLAALGTFRAPTTEQPSGAPTTDISRARAENPSSAQPQTQVPAVKKVAFKPSLLGRWLTSNHGCDLIVTKDDGKNIEANCGGPEINHNWKGRYSGGQTAHPVISVTVVRDNRTTNCQTTVDGTVRVIDDNKLVYTQPGWNDCDAHTGPVEIVLTRAP